MTSPLLSTKLFVPRVRKDLVSRQRLVARINQGMGRKVTLISAPAGFGKTTLLSEWVQQLENPAAWLSLDADDNDSRRFWAYCIAALQTVQPHLGEGALEVLQARQEPDVETLLANLINEMAQAPHELVLILDDLHMIAERRLHDEITFLVDNLPPTLHLVAATRADPPWPLARLRARGDMNEIRSQDLRFTVAEAAAFLNEVMELDLSSDDVATLGQRTEGWIVGLQMAALSMQGRADASRFVAAFGGTHRFILDYLLEEVLERQPPDLQRFLLETSILDRLTGPLCDAVREAGDGQDMLEQLEAANLFVVPLDDERRWYRYHHLFSDLLRSRLLEARPGDLPLLHLRASQWFEDQGLVVAALGHALDSGDIQRVTKLATGNALAVMGHGELSALTRWFDALPEGLRCQPWLAVSHAWVLAYAGQLARVEALLRDAADGLRQLKDQDGAKHIAGHMNAIRAYLAGLRGRMSRAAQLCRRALDQLPVEDLMARAFVISLHGSVLRWSGDLTEAARISNEAITMRQERGEHLFAADAFCDLAALQQMQGQLHAAHDTCQGALHSAEERSRSGESRASVADFAHTRLSAVLREWNDVAAAVKQARQGVTLAEQWGWADSLVFGYGYLAVALQASGDADGALQAIRDGKRIASTLSPWLAAQMAAREAELQVAQGNLAAAVRWAEESELQPDDPFAFVDASSYLTLARVLLSQGEQQSDAKLIGQALDLLERLLRLSESAGAMGRVVEILVAKALALQALGDTNPALSALERALLLAEPEGYVRTFIDQGAAIAPLLHAAHRRGIAVDYMRQLLEALPGDTAGKPAREIAPTSALVDPLSEREQQILRLLTSHLSSTEMAEQLYLSVHTVRTHIKSIYSKLGVHSRHDAIQRAQDLGLL
jgi:LuxR family maltose regulon positive regulatory protein